MDESVEFYFHNGLAPSTQRAYASAKRRYKVFCAQYKLFPLPASEHQLCQFVSVLAKDNLSHSTIKSYLPQLGTCTLRREVGIQRFVTWPDWSKC